MKTLNSKNKSRVFSDRAVLSFSDNPKYGVVTNAGTLLVACRTIRQTLRHAKKLSSYVEFVRIV